MPIGLIGRKCGMTRVFTEEGASIPVTVIEVQPNRVTQVKNVEKEGYCAIQVTTGACKSSRLSKPLAGHYSKANVVPGRGLWEFRLSENETSELKEGSEITVSLFKVKQIVDVIGKSKGRGFAGVIKRHNFSSQRASHGNSLAHNAPGSIGQNQTPGRVFKGKKMAGHMGDSRVTVKNLEVVQIDEQLNLLLVKGAVPGAPGGDVIIMPKLNSKDKNAA